MLLYQDLLQLSRQHNEILFSSIELLQANHGPEVGAFADEILGYLSHRAIPDAFGSYLGCHAELLQMSERFAATGRYAARRYDEVVPLDRERYNLRLLMSFIASNHRFEILQCLIDFIGAPVAAPLEVLSIGVGTGYEVKLMGDHLPNADAWRITACDSSDEALVYAADLLNYFGRPTDSLVAETFPLESAHGVEPYAGRFGKIVLCEVLEHLEDPDQALENLKIALHPCGHMFLTMAINLPQEDHIFLYESVEQARAQVRRHGLRIEQELATPATVFPFADSEREQLRAGNYICVVTK